MREAPSSGGDDDSRFEGREFGEPDFIKLQGLYIATGVIRNAEDLSISGFPVGLRRKIGREIVSIDVDSQVLNVWRGFALGTFRECQKEGLEGVAQAVIRKALRKKHG